MAALAFAVHAAPTEGAATGKSGSYYVVFRANGGNGKMRKQGIAVGSAAKLRENAFSRKGYVFLGWATSENGAVRYRNGATVKDLADAGKTRVLHAAWAKRKYKVSFMANGGNGKMAAQTFTYGKEKKLASNKFVRDNYSFKGWATSKANAKKGKVKYKNGKKVKNLVKDGSTIALYAVWEPVTKISLGYAKLVGYAAWRGKDGRAVPDKEKIYPGFLVTAKSSGHYSAKLVFKAISDRSWSRFYRFSKAVCVVANGRATTAEEVPIPGTEDFSMTVTMSSASKWGNDTHVDVEYILKDAEGNIVDRDKCRLLRPYVVAVGDSLTYGVMRYGSDRFLTPNWNWESNPYPTAMDWASLSVPHNARSPYNEQPDRTSTTYQGYRGFLAQRIPGFTWLGFDTNGHGPRHCGFPGATISKAFGHPTFLNLLDKPDSFMIIIMLAGANDASSAHMDSSVPREWITYANSISEQRDGNGRTLFLALKIPQIGSYGGKNNLSIMRNISSLNDGISSWSAPVSHRFSVSRTVNTDAVPHDDDDDGLHFLASGYKTMANIIAEALEDGLKQ